MPTKPGRIVTNARGGDSWHNYGLAADFVPVGPDGKWSWDLKTFDWRRMARIAEECGLEAGYFWRFQDPPHVQNRYGRTLAEVKELYRSGGLQKVWDELSRGSPNPVDSLSRTKGSIA